MSTQHTPGPWIVIERRHPYKDGSNAHIERNIYTELDDPQLKGKYPIVCTSVGIGMDGEKAISFAHIKEANARLIAAAPCLLVELKKAREVIATWNQSFLETVTNPRTGLIDDAQDVLEAEADQDFLSGIDAAIAKAEVGAASDAVTWDATREAQEQELIRICLEIEGKA